MKKIAIIGGGPAGLCAARHLYYCESDVKLQPVIFEQQECIGGTWVYKDVDIDNSDKVISSMYKNLKTNLPKQVMCFPDFDYPIQSPSYLHHTAVLKYTEDYADHFNLKQFVQLNSKVTSVSPILPSGWTADMENSQVVRWEVCVTNVVTGKTIVDQYDGVVVCSGHYSKPFYPDIKDIECFKGEIIHSHLYRDPEKYADKTVVVMGYGPSAMDIVCELGNVCCKVYFCKRETTSPFFTDATNYPANVVHSTNVKEITANGDIKFECGTQISADVLLLCTGYAYDYPYLTLECQIILKEECHVVTPLYKHIFNIKFPSLSFVGLTYHVTPAPTFHQQCAYIASILSGQQTLPTFKDMMDDTQNEINENTDTGISYRYFHRLGKKQWDYDNDLALLSGAKKNPPIIYILYFESIKNMMKDIYTYKSFEFKQIDETSFEYVFKSKT